MHYSVMLRGLCSCEFITFIRMKKFAIILLIISLNIHGQKKVLDHKDFDIWNRIQNSQISSNGDFIMYSLQRGEEDSFLKIKDKNANLILSLIHI